MIIYDPSLKSKIVGLKKLIIPSTIVLMALGLFGGWKLHVLEAARTPIAFDTSHIKLRSTDADPSPEVKPQPVVTSTGKYVGSRGGRSYYLPTCKAAKRIVEKNKIFFQTKEEAERFGYKPAKSCKGI